MEAFQMPDRLAAYENHIFPRGESVPAPKIPTQPAPCMISEDEVFLPMLSLKFGGPAAITAPAPLAPIPIQPIPRFALVVSAPDGSSTAITRRFEAGDASHCRLCPNGSCCAVQDVCLIMVPGVIAPKDATLHSTVGVARVYRR